jgi:outer membrane immunogenic protein
MAPRYTKAPPVVAEVWSWTGFYVGGFVGGAWDRENAVSTALPSPGFGTPAIGGAGLAGFGLSPTAHNLNRDGFIGGLYAGYNWQAGPYVLGIEGDFAYLDRTVSNVQPLIQTFAPLGINPRGFMTVTSDGHWLGSLRARAGYTWSKVMLYATGGAAFRDKGYTAAAVPVAGPVALNDWPGERSAPTTIRSDTLPALVVSG